MKKIFITMMGLMLALGSTAQFIRASIQKSATPHSVDVLFKSTYTSVAAETVNFLQLQVSLPSGVATNVTATITPLNNFASIGAGLQAVPPYVESTTGEKVYSWVYANPAGAAMPIWTNGVEFIGARITFNGNPAAPAQLISLIDLSMLGGGDNGQNFFGIATNQVPNDKTDYAAMFYQNAGLSTLGTYPAAGDQYVKTDQSVTLPIDLLTFSGYKDGGRNQLRWTTSTEINNQGFDVQRSLDGVNYTSIGFVNSLANGGNSSVALNYAFTDNTVTGLRQYYRLRQVDIGGNSKLSNIVLIKSDKPTLITIDGLFPNPATTTVNMLVGAPVKDKVIIQVYDMTGKAVLMKNMNVETGSNTLQLDVSALAGGNYMIKMTGSDGESTTAKFVKQ